MEVLRKGLRQSHDYQIVQGGTHRSKDWQDTEISGCWHHIGWCAWARHCQTHQGCVLERDNSIARYFFLWGL